MGLSIKNIIKKTFNDETLRQIAGHVGEGDRKIDRGVAAAVPGILQGMSNLAETDDGLHVLETELDKADVDVADTFGRRFNDTPNIMVEKGRSLMKSLVGADGAKTTAGQVASAAGVGNVSAEMITGAVAPVVAGALAKHRQTAGLSASGLRACLSTQLKETQVGAGGPVFPPGEAAPEESVSWSAMLFPLLALLGLIVLGVSLAGGVGPSDKKVADEDAAESASKLDADGNEIDGPVDDSENAEVHGGDAVKHSGEKSGEKVADAANVAAGKTADAANAAAGSAKNGVSSLADGAKGAAGNAKDGGAKMLDGAKGAAGKTADATKAGAGKATDAAKGAADAAKHGGTKVADGAKAAAGKSADAAKAGGKKAGSGKKAAAAAAVAAAGAGAANSRTNIAVALPAAVKKATRILNGVEDVSDAQAAIPKLDSVTDRIAELRGDQKRWPEATQSKVRRSLFTLMPAVDASIGKMMENDKVLTTMEKPLTKFIEEIDRLVPVR